MSPIHTVIYDQGCAVFWDTAKFHVPKTALELALKIDHTYMPIRLMIQEQNGNYRILSVSQELYFGRKDEWIYRILHDYHVYGILMRSEEDALRLEDELLKVYEWSILKA